MRLHTLCPILAALALATSLTAQAEIIEETGRIESRVEERGGGSVLQSDFAGLDFPQPNGVDPVAVTQLTRNNNNGDPISGAQGFTVLGAPLIPGVALPNDFGMDLAGFSSPDLGDSWNMNGSASERRRIVFRPLEVGAFPGQTVQATSTLYIAGALAIGAFNAGDDLTGTEARMNFEIVQTRLDGSQQSVLSGGLILRGGPNGSATVESSGAVNAALHAPISFGGVIDALPALHIVIFNPLLQIDQYNYDYQAIADEEFSLELRFSSDVVIGPGGKAGTTIFGIPPANVAEVFQRAQNADTGAQVEELINSLVDTTGSQVQPVGGTVQPVGLFTPGSGLCGALGIGGLAMMAVSAISALLARRRPQRARRSRAG